MRTKNWILNMDEEARKMARRLGMLAALAGDKGLAPSTRIRITTTCSSSSRASSALKTLLGTSTHVHKPTHTCIIKTMEKMRQLDWHFPKGDSDVTRVYKPWLALTNPKGSANQTTRSITSRLLEWLLPKGWKVASAGLARLWREGKLTRCWGEGRPVNL